MKQSFDIVFMDVQMPAMNGHDASRAIRSAEQGTGSRTPIIAMTAHAMKGDREQCLQAGMDDYLTKPVLIRELEAMLERFSTLELRSRHIHRMKIGMKIPVSDLTPSTAGSVRATR